MTTTTTIADALRAGIELLSSSREWFGDIDGSMCEELTAALRQYDDVLEKLRAALQAADRNAEMLEAARELLALKEELEHPQPPSAQADAVEELAALARFGAACLIVSREELCDLDAGWLQDAAEATGCLVREERAEPCGADCRCADEADSFPTQCLRVPDRLWRFAVSLDAGKETSR